MEILRRDSDYAVRALIAIASSGGYSQASEIAHEEEVSLDFLHKILHKLKAAGIVKVRRGPGGGFALAVPADKITLLQVIEAAQGPLAINRCFLGEDMCPRQKNCRVRVKLTGVQDSIRGFLEEITLEEMLENGFSTKP
jgi:Rrf2 family protein